MRLGALKSPGAGGCRQVPTAQLRTASAPKIPPNFFFQSLNRVGVWNMLVPEAQNYHLVIIQLIMQACWLTYPPKKKLGHFIIKYIYTYKINRKTYCHYCHKEAGGRNDEKQGPPTSCVAFTIWKTQCHTCSTVKVTETTKQHLVSLFKQFNYN